VPSSHEASFAALESSLAASPKDASLRLLDLLAFAADHLDDLIDSLGEDVVIANLHGLYDRFLAPVDVPWIPELVETQLIDPWAKSLIASAVKRAHARIHKE
jgi:hypothetical protein